jgi:hypothetical protein
MNKKWMYAIAFLCVGTAQVFGQTFNNVGPAYFPSINYLFNSQLQTAQNNVLMFQGNNVAGSNAVRNNLRVGIGVFPNAVGPVDRLHLHNITAVDVRMRITNSITGATATDGFFASVLSTGDAVLNQQENLSMRFHTNALERMRITANGLVGVNITAPTNQVEINSSFGSCTSGLTFTQLTSTCVPIVNPGIGVLAVDATGRVIYVTAPVSGANNGLTVIGGNVQLGQNCAAAGNPGQLISTREVPMAGFNMNYTMPAASPSQFNIGFPACTTIVSRFTVNNDFQRTAGAFFTNLSSTLALSAGAFRAQNNGTGNATGISASVLTTSSSATAIAVNGNSSGAAGFNSFYNIGVNAIAANASFASICVNADVTASTSNLNFGIESELTGNTSAAATNVSGSFMVFGNAAGSTNIGVRAIVPTATGGLGPDWAGYFGGDVFTTTAYYPSDRNLKKNIRPVENSLAVINKLHPVNYDFDVQNHANLGLSTVNQWGFISQEVQEILPELTKQTTAPAVFDSVGKEITAQQDILTLNYNGFIAILTGAIQEQQKLIEAQQQQIDQLMNMMQGGQNNPVQNHVNENEVILNNSEVIVLDQNSPNPFTNQTNIHYYIPQEAVNVQIQFFDMNGKMIKVSDIQDRGEGLLVVYAGELRDGVYSYSLIVDGKVIDTKRMVKTN